MDKPMILFALCFGLLVGCESPRSDSERSGRQPADSVTAKIDALRSLPYLSFSTEPMADIRGTVRIDSARSYPGYNFYTSRNRAMAVLMDAHGTPIHQWRGPPGIWARSVLLANGDLLAVGLHEDKRRYAICMSWQGEVRWKTDLESHHDIGPAPEGRYMLLTRATRRIPEISQELDVLDNRVTILSRQGRVMEHRSLYDMMAGRDDIFTFGQGRPGETTVDLFHANSVRWMTHAQLQDKHPIYSRHNIIVCIRHQDTVAIFNWPDSKLIWAWGQGELMSPHDASVLENGNLLIFDNGLGRGWSRVVELDPLSKAIVWEYRGPGPRGFFSQARGACQRLPNGNTLITESDKGRAFEVTADGEIVWEFFNTHGDEVGRREVLVRLYRLEMDFVDQILKQTR